MDWFYEFWRELGEVIRGWIEAVVPESAEGWVTYLVLGLLSILVLVNIPMVLVPILIYLERRLLGRFQNRVGPNRVGPFGVLQPIADAIKIMTKEDIIPTGADKLVFTLAPVAVMVPALLMFTVIPFGGETFLTNLNVGILFIVAVTAMETIGVFMAGWASNNKYALFGAMRAVAQLVSYEIPLVISIMGVVLIAGSMALNDIVGVQSSWPLILFQPLGFIIFFMAVSAELNRSPFDLMEAESEIIAGIHTEYSGVKFVMFLTAEGISLVGYSAVMATLYLSGWEGPGLPGYLWLLVKIFFIFGIFVWTRATLAETPCRPGYDLRMEVPVPTRPAQRGHHCCAGGRLVGRPAPVANTSEHCHCDRPGRNAAQAHRLPGPDSSGSVRRLRTAHSPVKACSRR